MSANDVLMNKFMAPRGYYHCRSLVPISVHYGHGTNTALLTIRVAASWLLTS